MKNIAVILSGCGVKDGSEIHEATLLLLAIDKLGAKYTIFAPNSEFTVVNHYMGVETDEKRNILIESARIARGEINDLITFDASKYDALILPGGFGAAKNLCTYAVDGANMEVRKDVAQAIVDMHTLHKPIGGLCIAPVVIAGVLSNGVNLTIGNDRATASDVEELGATHKDAEATEVVIDEVNNVYTLPCYMLATHISQVYEGIENLVRSILESLD